MHVGGTELASSRCNTLNSEINHCLERRSHGPPYPGDRGHSGRTRRPRGWSDGQSGGTGGLQVLPEGVGEESERAGPGPGAGRRGGVRVTGTWPLLSGAVISQTREPGGPPPDVDRQTSGEGLSPTTRSLPSPLPRAPTLGSGLRPWGRGWPCCPWGPPLQHAHLPSPSPGQRLHSCNQTASMFGVSMKGRPCQALGQLSVSPWPQLLWALCPLLQPSPGCPARA